jgi:hypothetical protein
VEEEEHSEKWVNNEQKEKQQVAAREYAAASARGVTGRRRVREDARVGGRDEIRRGKAAGCFGVDRGRTLTPDRADDVKSWVKLRWLWWVRARVGAATQGLTLVHFSAQLERCVRDRGCTSGIV